VPQFRVLKYADMEWVARLNALPIERRDIHFDPRILAPYFKAYGWEMGLAVTGDPDTLSNFIIQPVLITKEGQLRHAYNFGGPVGDVVGTLQLSHQHRELLHSWAKSKGAVDEFITFNPFVAQDTSGAEFIKDSVSIDLSNIKPRGTTRRAATKAQNQGVKVNSYYIYENMKFFMPLYEETMDRVGADDHWRFTPEWFYNYARFVYPTLLLATHEGKVVAGCLIAYKGIYQVAYYHFAASTSDCPDGTNQLMVLAAAELMKAKGAKHLYLGGGVKPNDGLFTFKSGFSKIRMPIFNYHGKII
jgi:hypothetical protein